MDRPTCNTCPYWHPLGNPETNDTAECRRNPPVLYHHARTGARTPARPVSGRYDWCGEHPSVPAWLAERDAGKVDIGRIVSGLSVQYRRVIELRYGLNGEECSLDETARILKITRERVRQREKNAIDLIREVLRTPALPEDDVRKKLEVTAIRLRATKRDTGGPDEA